MRFGKSVKEAKKEPAKGGSGGDFMRYIKDGDQTFRILQEQEDWVYYWEHYNPMGFSFPCNDTDPDNPNPQGCPGCSSDNEKMKSPSRKIAFNVLQSYNGQDYVNVYKIGSVVGDKLENRIARFGTITDRDYTVTRYKTSGDRYDFEVEGNQPSPVDVGAYPLKDIEKMLTDAWEESWGEAATPQAPAGASGATKVAQPPKRPTIVAAPAPEAEEEPPFSEAPTEPEEEKVYQETELLAMEYDDLVLLVKREMKADVPDDLTDTKSVVDWLLGQS